MLSSNMVHVPAPTGGHKYGTSCLSVLVFYSALTVFHADKMLFLDIFDVVTLINLI